MKARGDGQERPDLAFLLPSLMGGGAERVVMDLAREAARRGHTVDMIVLNRDGAVLDEVGGGVRLVELKRRRAAVALPALVAYLRRYRPRALLTTLEHTNVLAVVAGRLVGSVRVVVREANTVSEDTKGLKGRAVRELMRVTYRWAHAVIAVSRGVAASLEGELGLSPGSVTVIANPVVTQRVMDGAREPLDHPWFAVGQPPVVLGVGRLSEQKGFDTLLRAFASVHAATPCRLVILGEGPERDALGELARALGVEGDFALPGFVANPFSYMARCGVFVLSSRWEGLPNVLIQAMAVGAKVVATDCRSGPAEVTEGGALAPLVPVDDEVALADAIMTTLRGAVQALPEGWADRYEVIAITTRYLEVLLGDARAPGGTQ